ncbi:hypothetical protein BHE74_00047003 [Ensete ventricosum]|uniref:Uncharacterized protein n=1 Tax=Ensete ventricosum TaxID=4639 RepID=A0A426Y6H0_ENSVE|nr:hypothetical protein B296_00050377 [Ensete ventricosum]RWW47048.1 hypothetical protein BHE74_00047003 [Ensete ventricosum]RZS19566.1 hypothetical protein BHM03_00051979 [Ensete ventricosum]
MAGMSKLEAPVASSRSSTLDAAEHRATRRRKMVSKQRGRRARRRPASDADAASVSPLTSAALLSFPFTSKSL